MRKIVWTVLICSLAVFLVSAGAQYIRGAENEKSALAFQDMSSQLQALITAQAADGMPEGIRGGLAALFPAPNQQMGALPPTDDPVVLSYRDMAREQPDLVGWLRIDGTVIDYPVMRSPQVPEKYLHLSYDETYSRAGTPFMLPISDPSVPNENIIIYAHHMKDGSMFGSLPLYETKEAFDAQPYIEFDTLYGRGLYKIVAVFRTSIDAADEFSYYHYEWLDDEAMFDTYMRGVMANRLYDTGETATYGDRLLSLSTCDYQEPNGRLVVVAKLIQEEQKDV